jgi:NAD(P)H-nitrite reductase large subunit
MNICSCMPPGKGFFSGDLVNAVAEGCSTVKEVVAKTGCGTECHSCAKVLTALKPVVADLAQQRAAAVPGAWPSADEFSVARSKVAQTVMKAPR